MLHDEPSDGLRNAARKPHVVVALLATGFVMAGLMVHEINSSVLGGMHKNTELIERAPVDVFSGFHGSTAQFGGYGFPSGGHFSATLHEHSAGSSTTTFLLDHRLQYIVAGEVHVTDGVGNTHLGK